MNVYALNDTKRKLRQLKKLEQKIRRAGSNTGTGDSRPAPELDLVWNDFFLKKYPAETVAKMDRETYKKIIEEYFYYVYYKTHAENSDGGVFYDPEILSRLGLPPGADADMVKQKFRELAKLYHPDAGGDASDFINLKKNYDELSKR